MIDDSSQTEISRTNQHILADFHQRHGISVAYVGIPERTRFASELITLGFPDEIVKFGLLPKETGIRTAGANRNAGILAAVGRLFLSVDDDTECQLIRSPQFEGGLAFATGGYSSFDPVFPGDLWTFGTRKQLLDFARPQHEDLLSLHEALLGRTAKTCISECVDIREQMRLQTSEHFSSAQRVPMRVAVTLNGIAGDCGWLSPTHYLWVEGESFNVLTRTEDSYQIACSSREALRVARQSTIVNGAANMMGSFFGLDNRDILPPFPPLGRGQDVIFGRLVTMCIPGAAFGHLPWALLHSPIDTRFFRRQDILKAAFGVDLCVVTAACLLALQKSETAATDLSTQFHAVGQHFQQIGSMSESDSNEFIRGAVLTMVDGQFAELRRRADSAGKPLRSWQVDAYKLLQLFETTRPWKAYHLPIEFLHQNDPTIALKLTLSYLRKFGSLIDYWPEMVCATKTLSQCGRGLMRDF